MHTSRRLARSLFPLLLVTCALPACGSDDDASTDTSVADAGSADGASADGAGTDGTGTDGAATDSSATGDTETDAGPKYPPGNATFVVQGSVHQLFVIKADKDLELEVRDASGKVLATGKTDYLGSKVFRKLPASQEVRVYVKGADPEVRSDGVDILDVAGSQPPQSFYEGQVIQPGTGYLTMRDGTKLAYFATLPGPADKGPYPTIVNYSGYSPAKPGSSVVGPDQKFFCEAVPVLCNAPSDPSAMVAAVGGYATVSVNMRGTGCSGGAYDYFETLQLLDGYDVIETVAAQPWVKHHKVGMVGLSYPGITQLFVAKTQPPSLAAIAPVSIIGNTATTLVPGGILNSGFALAWIDNVYSKAKPYGQGWEQGQVDKGDTVCEDNQLLHDQRMNNVEQAKNSKYWVPEIIDPLNPTLFAGDVKVPVFMACAWQDEQTGPYFTTLLDKMTNVPARRVVLYNGVHSDGFAPQVLAEWKAFLDLHVAKDKPILGGILETLVGEFTKTVYGVAVKLPADRFKDVKDYDAALKMWQGEPEILVHFDNGGADNPGAPKSQFTRSFAQWPPKATQAKRWYLRADGSLSADKPSATPAPDEVTGTASTFELDPEAGDRGLLGKNAGKLGRGIWSAKPLYVWPAPKPGMEAAFVSAPLAATLVMVGTGSVDLWVRVPTESEAGAKITDADLEVTLTEVRPDGKEVLVQGGWLRATYRKLTKLATALWPEWSTFEADLLPVEAGKWTQMRVAIAAFGHVFRKDSRVRIAIDTPGDSRVDWRFALKEFPGAKTVRYAVAHTADMPSSVNLPVVQGVTVPDEAKLPPCPSLRGQPCRPYAPVANTPFQP